MPFYLTANKNKLSYPISKKSNKKISLPNAAISRKTFPSPRGNNKKSGKREAFRIFRKGSFTVEAAWAVPLFFLTVLALAGLMEIYGVYVRNMVRLQEEVEKQGMYAAAAGSGEELMIDRTETVYYQPPWLPFAVPGIKITCRGRVRAWTGRSAERTEAENLPGHNKLVYVTEYESVYHTTSRCSHLSLSIRQVAFSGVGSQRNNGGGRYQPCEKCVGKGGISEFVYITDQGECYHNSLECSGLKRRVRLEELSSLEGLDCCSRCQQLEREEGK